MPQKETFEPLWWIRISGPYGGYGKRDRGDKSVSTIEKPRLWYLPPHTTQKGGGATEASALGDPHGS